jgi:hypothetical protein
LKHRGNVRRAEFSPDSRCLLTESTDGSARLWDIGSGARLSPHLDPEGWAKQAFAAPGDPASWQLPMEERPVEVLRIEAEWLSAHHIQDQTGGLVPNSPERLRALKELIQSRHPELLRPAP